MLGGLILFEIFNYFEIFKFSLDFTWFGLIITGLVVWIGLEISNYFLEKRGCKFYTGIWAVAAIPLYFDALGDINRFYSRFNWYDLVGHFLGGLAAGIIIFSIVKSQNIYHASKASNLLTSFTTFTSVVTLGVFYEIEEFTENYFNLTNRLGNANDTVTDLMMDGLGAIVAILIMFLLKNFKVCKKQDVLPQL
jgi:hypothetical protein